MKAVITVVGKDTVGVVARVGGVCGNLNINIEDITQSIMQEMFCMIMLVDLSRCNVSHEQVREALADLGKEMGMQVTITRQEVKLFALGIAIMLRIIGFHLPRGSVDHLVNTLLGDHRCCPLTESAILQSHLRIGPDIKGSTDVGT